MRTPIRHLAALCAVSTLLFSGIAFSALPPKPKLIVAIAIDQFSAGLFEQYRPTFDGGLGRLTEGVVFPNGYQTHAVTETCVGHSTILTGRHPSATGIAANEWMDEKGRIVYCVEDRSVTVPGRPEKPRGPANLRVKTLGEWLKAADSRSRTVAVSGKDRAAITMAGHGPDAVFWWDDERRFNTYVAAGDTSDRLAPVRDFNAAIERSWQRKPPAWKPLRKACAALNSQGTYDEHVHLDHRVPPASTPGLDDPAFNAWVRQSPVLDQLTLDLAASLLDRYRLGRGEATDLLALSLSATDYVGHRYGNQGPEMCDQLAHLDRALGKFFKLLDATKVPYVVVLTADHGAVDAAERTVLRGFPAERMTHDVAKEVNTAVRERLGLTVDPFRYAAYGLYLIDRSVPAQPTIAAAVDILRQQSWVTAAFSKEEIRAVQLRKGVPPDELSLEERYSESLDVERSPDIMITFKPYATLAHIDPKSNYIAWAHGSPWNYDRRVPILMWWPGAGKFEQYLPVETVDIAPTLAALANIQPPQVDGRCLDLDPGTADTCRSKPQGSVSSGFASERAD